MIPELSLVTLNASPMLGAPADLATTIADTAAAGFELIALDTYAVQGWVDDGHEMRELADLLASVSQRCFELGPLCIRDSHAATLAEARLVSKMAAALDVEWVVVNAHATRSSSSLRSWDDALAVVEDRGARAALEYVAWHPVDGVVEARRWVDAVPRRHPGVLVDTWHHFRGSDADGDLDELPLEQIAYLQFDDARAPARGDLREDSVRDRTFPGEGVFELDKWCALMRDKGYDGPVSVEILDERWRTSTCDRAEFARRAYESTRRFWPGDAR